MKARDIFEYNKLTWPEMNDAIEMQKVVILPTGSTEQHGPHMPLDVDLFLVREVCHELGRRAPDKVLVLPAIPCGLNLHHIDFPGTIHIQPDHFINYCVDVTKSVAYHGFQRIAVVNGHGSNMPMVDLVARRTVLETPSICCAFGYFAMGKAEYEPAAGEHGPCPRRRDGDLALSALRQGARPDWTRRSSGTTMWGST